MGGIKYKLTVLFFIAAVTVGVSFILSEFNHRVCPAIPVSAFSLEGDKSGVYQVEFLGEKIRVELPVSFDIDLFIRETVENSKEWITSGRRAISD